LMERRWKIKVN
jgi:hypothetical protein